MSAVRPSLHAAIPRLLVNRFTFSGAIALAVFAFICLEVWLWNTLALASLGLAVVLVSALLVWFGLAFAFPNEPRIPVGEDDAVARINGSSMRYRRKRGSGPPLMLVHGGGDSLEVWQTVVDQLPGRDVIALDLIGHGGSDRPADLNYDIESQHRYLVGFMDALDLDEVVLVGHSKGGAIVGGVAMRESERVLGTVLIAPAGVPGALSYRWPKNVLCRPGVVNRFGSRVARTSRFRRAFPFRPLRQHLGLTGSFDDEYERSLSRIESPMMLIWSSGDRRCLPEYADVYRAHVDDLDVRILPDDVGHMVPEEEPSLTADLVEEFVDGLDAQPS